MDNDKLQEIINESGYKLIYIASKIGIHRTALYKKLNGHTKWNEEELKILYDLLDIKGEIDNE